MRHALLLFLFTGLLTSCGSTTSSTDSDSVTDNAASEEPTSDNDEVEYHPVYHGSLVLTRGEQTIFVDPHGGAERYTEFGTPDLVLITHTHGDHMDSATLAGIDLSAASLVGPAAVTEGLGDSLFTSVQTLANGETYTWEGIEIMAVPAYNPPPKENFHPQGQFNGYVLDFGNDRVYVSGDTEGVPAMRELSDIDVAFVCMNLPYTMDVNQAADAVLAFEPSVVYPYHYRNQDGTKSDLEQFREIVNAESEDIEVRIEDWYGE